MDTSNQQDHPTNHVDYGTSKKPTGLIVGMVACAVLAVAGLAFGAYGMIDSGSKSSQISILESELKGQQPGSSELGQEIIGSNLSKNPVISAEPPYVYSHGASSTIDNTNGKRELSVTVQNGKITSCTVMSAPTYDGVLTFDHNCEVTGLTGEIYKAVELHAGQYVGPNYIIAFIMTDGTVEYLSVLDALDKSDYSIKGKLNINGFVKDAFRAAYYNAESPAYGGGPSAVFVLSDNTYAQYSDDMLQ